MGEWLSLNIELTDHCNLKCRMCDQAIHGEAPHGTPRGHISREVWERMFDSLEGFDEEVHISAFWLGEPLVHPDFAELIRLAFDKNTGNRLFRDLKVHTNGVLLEHERLAAILDCAARADQIEDTFSFVHCSIEAVRPETYEAIKGSDQLERVERNLLGFLDARQARGLVFPKLTVAFIVMPDNESEAESFLQTWKGHLEARNLEYQLTADWPPEKLDTIYFRRLSTSDQQAADALHRRVVERLGIPAERAAETF